MLLSEGKEKKRYIIKSIDIDTKLKRRLEVLGLINNTQIEIINKSLTGSLIIKVRGTRFAISTQISKYIETKEVI